MNRYRTMLAVVLFVFCIANFAHASGWTEWQQLNDTAYNGIYFSYNENCPHIGANNCNFSWSFKNAYNNDVEITYRVNYLSAAGTEETASGNAELIKGENRLSQFRVTGRKLTGVTVGLVLPKETQAQVKKEQNEKKAAEERKRQAEEKQQQELAQYYQDHPEAAEEMQRQTLAMMEENNRREDEFRRQQEETRRQDEFDREEQRRRDAEESDRRQEENLARIKREGAERDAFNQRLVDGVNDLGRTTRKAINNYYDVKNTGIEAENSAREQQRQAKLEAEREQRVKERRESKSERQRVTMDNLYSATKDYSSDNDSLGRHCANYWGQNLLCTEISTPHCVKVIKAEAESNGPGRKDFDLHVAAKNVCSMDVVMIMCLQTPRGCWQCGSDKINPGGTMTYSWNSSNKRYEIAACDAKANECHRPAAAENNVCKF